MKPLPGWIARMITVMIERVLAGESAKRVADDYGPWEWDAPPNLRPIERLRKRALAEEGKPRARRAMQPNTAPAGKKP